MPKTAELADRILSIVAEEMETPKELILSKSRTSENVDARHLAIMLLHLKDVYPKRIAEVSATAQARSFKERRAEIW